MPHVIPVSACRVCGDALGHAAVLAAFDDVPVAGVYVPPEDPRPDPRASLRLCRCRRCGLVQLGEALTRDFYGQYRFVSGIGSTYREHLARIADRLSSHWAGGRLLEIGASDGTFLRLAKERGLAVAGFEPSAVAAQARAAGLDVVADYFDARTAERSPLREVDVVVVRHVLEHLDEFASFFSGIQAVTHEGSVVVVEVPDLVSTAEENNFGNVYHPHGCYFDRTTLGDLFARYGWTIERIQVVPIFGGSLFAVASRRAGAWRWPGEEPDACALESAMLSGFAARWRPELHALRDWLRALTGSGLRVAGYGAAERTGAILGASGLGRSEIGCLYDRNPALIGLAVAGSRIPIRHPDRIEADRPDVLVIFARSLEDEIVASLGTFRQKGGRIVSLRTTPPSFRS